MRTIAPASEGRESVRWRTQGIKVLKQDLCDRLATLRKHNLKLTTKFSQGAVPNGLRQGV